MLPSISIGPEYLVADSGTSDGTQIKYLYQNKWYKVDRYGGEGACEELASHILNISSYDPSKYVAYEQVIINGRHGCVSENFVKDNETFQTIYRLHSNILGRDPAVVTAKMDYDDAIEYIISFVKKYTDVDITEYLADTFVLDAFILNEDRHFNNLGVIFDGDSYRPAPIFDNGKSLFTGNSKFDPNKSISENKRIAFAKAFSGDFSLNMKYLQTHASFVPDRDRILKNLSSYDLNADSIYRRLYELCQMNMP